MFAVFAFVLYFAWISYFNIAQAGDSLSEIMIRFTASVCGVYLVVKSVFTVYSEKNPITRFLNYIGKHTLELYYIHYLFVAFLSKIEYTVYSALGIFSLFILYVTMIAICAAGIILSKASPVLSFVLFGKSNK